MVPKANILSSPQGLPCRDRTPDVLLRLHHTYLLPEKPLFYGNTSASSQLQAFGQICGLQCTSAGFWRQRLHRNKMLTAFPKEMQVWIETPASSLHAQPSGPCRHGCIAMNKWSWQKLSSGESKVGMESGKMRIKYGLEKDTGFCCTAQESRTG